MARILSSMPATDSALDPNALARARTLLKPPRRDERSWPALAAAGLLAFTALAFATAMMLAPPRVSPHAARTADD